jgi:two-component system cell cycle sensor histidine kinase PleC
LTLINEILDLSRVEAGRYDLQEEAVMLGTVAQECQHLMELRANEREQTIITAIEQTLPGLWADGRALRQVTLNLLSNAIKFTPAGGRIELCVGWTANGGAYLSVRDNGPGIPAEEIPLVLSSFGRGTNAQKSEEAGSGLGLPIAKSLVELHGGRFAIHSKLGQGTQVIAVFPPERVMTQGKKLSAAA